MLSSFFPLLGILAKATPPMSPEYVSPPGSLILSDKWILVKKYRIPGIQLTDHMKFNNNECPSKDAPIPLGKKNKIIMGSRGAEELGRKGVGRGAESGMGGDGGDIQRVRKLNRGV